MRDQAFLKGDRISGGDDVGESDDEACTVGEDNTAVAIVDELFDLYK
jgi:hypothetical protein